MHSNKKKQHPETKSTYHIRFNITLQYFTLVFGNSYITGRIMCRVPIICVIPLTSQYDSYIKKKREYTRLQNYKISSDKWNFNIINCIGKYEPGDRKVILPFLVAVEDWYHLVLWWVRSTATSFTCFLFLSFSYNQSSISK